MATGARRGPPHSQAACGGSRSPEGHRVARPVSPQDQRENGCSHHPDAHPTRGQARDTDSTPSGGPHGTCPGARGRARSGGHSSSQQPRTQGRLRARRPRGSVTTAPCPALTTATASKALCSEMRVVTEGHSLCTSRMDFKASAVQSATIQPQSSVLKGKAPCGARACDRGRGLPGPQPPATHVGPAPPSSRTIHTGHSLPPPPSGPATGQAQPKGKAPSRPEDTGTVTSTLTALSLVTSPVTPSRTLTAGRTSVWLSGDGTLVPSVGTAPHAQPLTHHCTRDCVGSTRHPARGPSGRQARGPRRSAPRRRGAAAAAVPCTSGGSTSGSRAGCLGPGRTGGNSHHHGQSPGQTGSSAAGRGAPGLWPLDHGCLRKPSGHHPAHHWGMQSGIPGAEEGRVGATGGPQSTPVTCTETRAPSAGRTRTRACAGRRPGKGKREWSATSPARGRSQMSCRPWDQK